MASKKWRARLQQAMSSQTIVRVERKPKHADRVYGVVLRMGSKWVLMRQITDGGYQEGLFALRLKDVKRVSEDETVATPFARSSPDWPPSYSSEIDLDSTTGVLNGLGQSGGLIGIQKEFERSAMWIGTLDSIRGRFVYLHEVRTDATWYPEALGYRLTAITSVETGSRYIVALSAIAGDGPESGSD
ncbi:hypothetical protein [Microbacterium sp. PMB16]|uniref:hypothetical protein n=1 Tax=Microbacterium sp. PMB16 TaxID=3120157 RepID=UPI003F4B35A7